METNDKRKSISAISRRNFISVGSTTILASACSAAPEQNSEEIKSRLATIYNSEEFLMDGPGGRKLRIQISHPHPDDPFTPDEMKGLKPVPIYVLDGGWAFGLFSSVARYLQWGREQPPCLVIGIAYQNMVEAGQSFRRYDFTPANPDWAGWPDEPETSDAVGGGPRLREFLSTELAPLIERRYDVDASRSVLFGHSFGGLFALNTWLAQGSVFSRVLAVSPSIWFANARLLSDLERKLSNDGHFGGKVAVYVGGREEEIAGESFKMTSNVITLSEMLDRHSNQVAGKDIRVLDDRTHHNILGPAATLGLEYLLS
jgi:predicted alpha/beta superfamily hydrolase